LDRSERRFWGELPKRKRYLAKHSNCSATRNLNYDKKPRLEANPAGFSVESATVKNGAIGTYVQYLNGLLRTWRKRLAHRNGGRIYPAKLDKWLLCVITRRATPAIGSASDLFPTQTIGRFA
jgi:hypothetical protein